MRKAFINALIYYLGGATFSYVIYLLFGHEYIHAPGFHYLLILLTFFIGFLLGLFPMVEWLKNRKEKNNEKWAAIFYLIPVLVFVIWIVIEIMNYP